MFLLPVLVTLLSLTALVVCLSLYILFIKPGSEKRLLDNKIEYINSLTKIYKQVDDKTKNLLYLDALKEIEIAKYQELAKAYKNAKVNIFSTDSSAVSEHFGAKQGASLGHFMKAVELVAGTSMADLAQEVADKMKNDEVSK